MRIITIIQNQLLLEKLKLENELERTLNDRTLCTDEVVNKSVGLVHKLTNANSSIQTWELYLNKEEKKI
jgi:hypothetical protein|tara:strand:+ start:2579 stop:2785 length:207 start_codon:yes stop_codon:yes gene_type:complete